MKRKVFTMKKITAYMLVLAMVSATLLFNGCGKKEDLTATTMKLLNYIGEV